MRTRWATAACLIAGTFACGANEVPGDDSAGEHAEAAAPPATAVPVFEYLASDGEFGLVLTLASDGAWTHQEHSGFAAPSGRLSPALMARFRSVLDAAPFRSERGTCDGVAEGQATYRDLRRSLTAHGTSRRDPQRGWVPCESVDAATARLPSCLMSLMGGDDTGC